MPPASAALRTAQTLLRHAAAHPSPMAAVLAGPSGRVAASALRRGVGGLSSSSWRPAPPTSPPPGAASSQDASTTSPNLPPPLTVTRLPPTPSPPTTADLANAFAAAGFSDVKVLSLGADHALSSHATPVPKLLGIAAGRFLISVDPHDPAEDGDGDGGGASNAAAGAAAPDESAALQLAAGTFLLMPAGVRHSAWVVGGAPVDLVVGSRPSS